MKDFVSSVLDFLLGILKYIPERMRNNKFFWIFSILISTIVFILYFYFFF